MEYTVYTRHLDQENFGFEITPPLSTIAAEGLTKVLQKSPAAPFTRAIVIRQSDEGTAILARPNGEIFDHQVTPEFAATHVQSALATMGMGRAVIETAIEPPEGAFTAQELGEQYDELKSGLMWYLMRKFWRNEELEDAVQESFVAAWRYRHRTDHMFPRQWFNTVALRQSLRLLSKKKEQLTLDGELPEVAVSSDDEEYRATYHSILAATKWLPPQQRRVAVMLIEGADYATIADTLHMNISTVRTTACFVRKKMRDILD